MPEKSLQSFNSYHTKVPKQWNGITCSYKEKWCNIQKLCQLFQSKHTTLAVEVQPYNNTSNHLNWCVDWRDLHNSLYVLIVQYEMCVFWRGPMEILLIQHHNKTCQQTWRWQFFKGQQVSFSGHLDAEWQWMMSVKTCL
jgi:hypothetical protein